MITKGKEGKERLLEGINETADVVSTTMGAKGRTVMISDPYGLGFHVTKDGVSVANSVKLENDLMSLGSEFIKTAALKTDSVAGDGPQPLYSKILTPNGWVTMGSLKKNDIICGTNNTFQKVIDIFPKGIKEIYRLNFSNGQEVECCEDHLWNVSTDGRENKTMSLSEIIKGGIKRYKYNGKVQYSRYFPTTSVEFVKRTFHIDPLLVGLLIGDGSLHRDSSIELSLAIGQESIMEKVILPEGIEYKVKINFEKNYSRIKFKRKNNNGPTMHDYVDRVGLLEL